MALCHSMSAALHGPRCLSVVCAMVHVCLDPSNVDVVDDHPGSDVCLMFDVWMPHSSGSLVLVTAPLWLMLFHVVR